MIALKTLNELTMKDLDALQSIEEDPLFSKTEKRFERASILTGIPSEDITIKDLVTIESHISDSLKQPEIPNIYKEITVKDRTFKIDYEPPMDATNKDNNQASDWLNFIDKSTMDPTVKQCQAFEALSKQDNKDWRTMFSLMFIPKGHEYGIGYSTEEVGKFLYENLSAKQGLEVYNFFLPYIVKLRIFTSLVSQKQKAIKQLKKETNPKTRAGLSVVINQLNKSIRSSRDTLGLT